MKDLNSIVLIGRVVKDLELKYLNSGTPISDFSLAVNDSFKKGDKYESFATEAMREIENLKYAADKWGEIVGFFQDNPDLLNLTVGDDITKSLLKYFIDKKANIC